MKTTRYYALFLLLLILNMGVNAQDSSPEIECEERVKQSVVLIIPLDDNGATTGGSGSGVIVDPRGIIYTNRHVIEKGDKFLIFLVEDPNRPPVLRYIAVDYGFTVADYADFAILQINQTAELVPNMQDNFITRGLIPGTLDLQHIIPATNTNIRQGDGVRVFGFPGVTGIDFGSLFDSLPILNRTQGQITSIRDLDFDQESLSAYLYTDAGISPGNSGGIAINDSCEYIGIPTESVVIVNNNGDPIGPPTGIIYPISTLLHLVPKEPLITEPSFRPPNDPPVPVTPPMGPPPDPPVPATPSSSAPTPQEVMAALGINATDDEFQYLKDSNPLTLAATGFGAVDLSKTTPSTFVLQTEFNFTNPDDECRLVFRRVDADGGDGYWFRIFNNRVVFQLASGSNVQTFDTSNIRQTESNLAWFVVNGSDFALYLNDLQSPVAVISDSQLQEGVLRLAAQGKPNATACNYRNTWIWQPNS